MRAAVAENERVLKGTGARLRPVPDIGAESAAAFEQLESAAAALDCGLVRRRAGKIAMVAADLIALSLSFAVAGVLSALLGGAALSERWHWLFTAVGVLRVTVGGGLALVMVLCFWGVLQHYANRRPFWTELRDIWMVIGIGFFVDTHLLLLLGCDGPRNWPMLMWLCAAVLLPLLRFTLKYRLLARGWMNRPYIVVGAGVDAEEVVRALASEPLMGFRPVAIVLPPSCADHAAEVRARLGARLPVVILDANVEDFLTRPGPAQLVAVIGENGGDSVRCVAERAALRRDDVFMVAPALGRLPLYGLEVYQFFSHEVLLLRTSNHLSRRFPRVLKRAVDVAAAVALLGLTSPLLLFVAWRIRRESRGPVIFTQDRVGYDGGHFPIFKFRSMVIDADQLLEQWKTSRPELWEQYVANNFKLVDDPRVTPIGRWLRRTSVDELPQLLNVLRGDMSLVGPRPLLPRELDFYGDSIRIYTNVRPGITGLWQIGGRSDTTFSQRIALDGWYIRNWSIWHDLVILFKTVRVVLVSEGAR